MFDYFWPHGLQNARLPCTSLSLSLLKFMSFQWVMEPSYWTTHYAGTISSFVPTFSSCHQSFPGFRVFSNELAFPIRWPKHWSFSFRISPSNEYSGLISFRIDWFYLFAVQDSQDSSPTPQFKSINSLAFRLLYSPALTSIHDYWKNHSFNYTDLCWQSNVSAF